MWVGRGRECVERARGARLSLRHRSGRASVGAPTRAHSRDTPRRALAIRRGSLLRRYEATAHCRPGRAAPRDAVESLRSPRRISTVELSYFRYGSAKRERHF